jgi:hypothetical protein
MGTAVAAHQVANAFLVSPVTMRIVAFSAAFIGLLLSVQICPEGAAQWKLTAVDRVFLEKAAQANLAEVAAAKMAQAKATRTDIKRFAQEMVRAAQYRAPFGNGEEARCELLAAFDWCERGTDDPESCRGTA